MNEIKTKLKEKTLDNRYTYLFKMITELFSNLGQGRRLQKIEEVELEVEPTLNYVDLRKKLPWHPKKKWRKRSEKDIIAVCFHQTFGGDDPKKTNEYHIGPNHISETGCPHICYTYYVNKQGTVYLCNDHTDVPWSQNADDRKGHPGDENRHCISVVFGMREESLASRGRGGPTKRQILAFKRVWRYLKHRYGLENNAIFGHYHFGKGACPGPSLSAEIEAIRAQYDGKQLKTGKQWQRALHNCDIKFGTKDYGKIDGNWGPKSKRALVAYQRREGLRVTGVRDPFTELWLLSELRQNNKISKV